MTNSDLLMETERSLENENKVGPRAGVRRGHAVMFKIDGTPGKYDQNWL